MFWKPPLALHHVSRSSCLGEYQNRESEQKQLSWIPVFWPQKVAISNNTWWNWAAFFAKIDIKLNIIILHVAQQLAEDFFLSTEIAWLHGLGNWSGKNFPIFVVSKLPKLCRLADFVSLAIMLNRFFFFYQMAHYHFGATRRDGNPDHHMYPWRGIFDIRSFWGMGGRPLSRMYHPCETVMDSWISGSIWKFPCADQRPQITLHCTANFPIGHSFI